MRHPRARRNSSVSKSACGRARKAGGSCWSTSRRAASLSHPSWRPATGRSASGRRSRRCRRQPGTSAVLCTRPRTCSTSCPNPSSQRARLTCARFWAAPDRATARAAIATFAEKYRTKYEKAVSCLIKDRDALLTFYDFPAEHWDHLRTSNPIESVFATVRHRTVRTKGALSQDTARLMVFKLVMAAAKTWRRLKGENQLPKVVQGVTFRNGVEVTNTPAQNAA